MTNTSTTSRRITATGEPLRAALDAALLRQPHAAGWQKQSNGRLTRFIDWARAAKGGR